MARTLEMIFDARVTGVTDLDRLQKSIEATAKSTNLSEGNLKAFYQVLNQTAQSTNGYTVALRQLAGQSSIFQSFAKNVKVALDEQNKAADATAKAASRAAAEFESAKKREAKAAQDAADKIIAQQTRLQNALGRVGARLGGSALGQAAGLPGLGRAGGTILGAMGLPSSTMMGIGGAAAGIFAGVEFAKQIDQIAKWAQEQKNLAASIGITVTEAQQLSRVSERTGVDMDGVAKSVAGLSNSMFSSSSRAREVSSALEQLGLRSSVAFESPIKATQDIATGLAGVVDPARRAELAVELLGEEGRKVAANLDEIRSISSRGVIDGKTIEGLAEAHRELADFGDAWDVLKAHLATPIVGILRVNRDWTPTYDQLLGQARSLAGAQSQRLSPGIGATADLEAQRAANWRAYGASHGTPEDRYRATLDQISTDRKNLQDRYQSGAVTDSQMATQRAALDAREAAAQSSRKTAEEYRNQVESFQRDRIAPVDSADVFKQLTELPKRYNLLSSYGPYQDRLRDLGASAPGAFRQIGADMLGKQFPGLATGDYQKIFSPLNRENTEYSRDLERGERDARASQEQLLRESQIRIEGIGTTQRDSTETNEAALRLQTAQMSGARSLFSKSNQLSSTGIAQLDLDDAIKLIVAGYTAKAGPITAGLSQLQREPVLDEKQKAEVDRKIDEDKAQLQKLQNDALTQSVEAVDKFNESIQDASNKLRSEFGSFAFGLVSAARSGHAGTYARNFGLGQFDKVVDNFAQSIYRPGMLSIPGQGTATNPTFLGTLLKGTVFSQDPKAQGDMATKDNTVATQDNTTALVALYAALGGDPGSLSISSGSSVSIPFFGANSAPIASIARAAGVSIPGLTSSGGAFESGGIGGLVNSVARIFTGGGALSTGAGIYGPTDANGIAIIPGVTGGIAAPQAQARAASTASGAVRSPLTGKDANGNDTTASGYIGAGVATAGALYGVYQGASTLAKGGARNVASGIGTIAGSAAALDPEPISKGILAGVALVSGIVSSLMGDPRAARAKQLTEEQQQNTYVAPNPLNLTTNAGGFLTTTDFRGRVESLGALPSVSRVNAITGFDAYDPSHVLSSSQWTLNPSGMIPPSSKSGSSAAPSNVTLNIQAFDNKSIMDRGHDIASALVPVLQGTHRLNTEIQRVVSPR